jgi:excisionase family DNA binding protein
MSLLNPPRFLTSDQAAEYIGVRPQTLDAWRCLKRHLIPFTRVGRLIRYRVEDLDAWLASRTEGRDESMELANA